MRQQTPENPVAFTPMSARAEPTHLGYVGSGALGYGGGRGWAHARVGGKPGEERGALAAGMRAGRFSAGGEWTYVELIHVQTHLMADVQIGVRRFAEAHVVALALLVLFAFASVEGGGPACGDQAFDKVVVELF
jgi:hypothetical protein